MFRLRKLHKYAGIFSGVVLLLLSLTGFFLNHDNWNFLYSTSIPNSYLPKATVAEEKRLFNSYIVDKNQTRRIVAGFQGIFIQEKGTAYRKVSSLSVHALAESDSILYAATTNGIWYASKEEMTWKPLVLQTKVVTSLSIDDGKILAAIDKKRLVLLDTQGTLLKETDVKIEKKYLDHDITLARFVRDLHYGRGIFDYGLSLFLNDLAALWLVTLALSGYLLWYFIRHIRGNKHYKRPIQILLKVHASSFVLVTVIPLILLAVTGIVLDHSRIFSLFLKETKVSSSLLPPVYHTLKEDIWSVDYFNGVYRIGNRYGVFRSSDMQHWILENKGFAYCMMHTKDILYVSGMGAPNRIYKDGRWHILTGAPHMFKSMNMINEKPVYFSSHLKDTPLPKLNRTSLYTLMYSIHDGSFFSSWWAFVDDIASVLLLLLLFTGLQLWYKRFHTRFP
ncbi:MAG: PepSY domain-containing protein [Sulfurovum sp.]|nr:PepSY domain-containing protein [Sulfurovum sp.]